MQENKFVKIIFKTSLILFVILIVFYLLNFSGIFNFYYKNKFIKTSQNIDNLLKDFLAENERTTEAIVSDPIIKGAILQYQLGENIIPALKVMNMYKENYTSLKNITLFDYEYKIITADIENISLLQKLPQDWFYLAQADRIYMSPIYYAREINSYVISFLLCIMNVVDEVTGFIKADFTIENLLNKFDKYDAVNIIIFDIIENKVNFIYPLDKQILLQQDEVIFDLTEDELKKISISGFKLAVGKKIRNSNIALIVTTDAEFFSLPLEMKIFLLSIFLICILSYIYILVEKKQKQTIERKEKFKGLIADIVTATQKTEKHNIELLENIPKKTDEPVIEKRSISKNNEENPAKIDKEKKIIKPTTDEFEFI